MKLKVFEFNDKFLININEYSCLSAGPNKQGVYDDIMSNYNRLLENNTKEESIKKMVSIMSCCTNPDLIDFSLKIESLEENFKIILPDKRELYLKKYSMESSSFFQEQENNEYFSLFLNKEKECNLFANKNQLNKEINTVIENIITENFFCSKTPMFLFDNVKLRQKINYLPLLYLISYNFII